jgi:hypothetical protein
MVGCWHAWITETGAGGSALAGYPIQATSPRSRSRAGGPTARRASREPCSRWFHRVARQTGAGRECRPHERAPIPGLGRSAAQVSSQTTGRSAASIEANAGRLIRRLIRRWAARGGAAIFWRGFNRPPGTTLPARRFGVEAAHWLSERFSMKSLPIVAATLLLAPPCTSTFAAGCQKGAAGGGLAGHMAGRPPSNRSHPA